MHTRFLTYSDLALILHRGLRLSALQLDRRNQGRKEEENRRHIVRMDAPPVEPQPRRQRTKVLRPWKVGIPDGSDDAHGCLAIHEVSSCKQAAGEVKIAGLGIEGRPGSTDTVEDPEDASKRMDDADDPDQLAENDRKPVRQCASGRTLRNSLVCEGVEGELLVPGAHQTSRRRDEGGHAKKLEVEIGVRHFSYESPHDCMIEDVILSAVALSEGKFHQLYSPGHFVESCKELIQLRRAPVRQLRSSDTRSKLSAALLWPPAAPAVPLPFWATLPLMRRSKFGVPS